MKGYWLVSGLVCIAIGLYSTAHEKEQSVPDLGSASLELMGMTSTASTPEDPAQEMRRITDSKPRAVEASVFANSSVAGLPPMDAAPFLDPDGKSIAVNQSDINRTPVNVGKYIDANDEFLPLSEGAAGGIEQTSINVGEYLDPDGEPHEPLVTNNGDSGNTHSDVGHYLDPDAESSEALSADPLNQKNVGSLLEVGI
jgi:hypothetical protein